MVAVRMAKTRKRERERDISNPSTAGCKLAPGRRAPGAWPDAHPRGTSAPPQEQKPATMVWMLPGGRKEAKPLGDADIGQPAGRVRRPVGI